MNGRVVRCLETGLGRHCLLLHAFPLGADMWRPQLERVPAGWHFIAPDFRGFGGSSIDSTRLGMADYAGDVLKLMDSLSMADAVIGGLSMGGYVAFEIFRQAPERVSGLLLADTRASADSDEGRRSRSELLETVRTRGVKAVADEMLPKVLGATTQKSRPEVVAEVRRLIESTGAPAIEAATFALMRRIDSTPDLPHIACPTLIVVGSEDVVTPVKDAEAMKERIRGAQLSVIPEAGHLSSLEAPEVFSTTITTWVASLH